MVLYQLGELIVEGIWYNVKGWIPVNGSGCTIGTTGTGGTTGGTTWGGNTGGTTGCTSGCTTGCTSVGNTGGNTTTVSSS